MSPVICHAAHKGVTGIFFWGGKVKKKKSILVDPKQISVALKSEKQKTKEKKKGSSHLFIPFPPFISHFHLSIFLVFSYIFPFFLASFFLVSHQKFPGQKSQGVHSAPCLLCHWQHIKKVTLQVKSILNFYLFDALELFLNFKMTSHYQYWSRNSNFTEKGLKICIVFFYYFLNVII